MSVRLKRLEADYQKVIRLFRGNGRIEIKSASGNPPEKYQIEYHIRGLEQIGNRIAIKEHHLVEITLPFGYPREAPQCRMLTPVFHPNIAPQAICIGDHWAAGESLADLIVRIGEMICYQSYNIKSPLNGEAARWADKNTEKLPIDSSDLLQIARRADDYVVARHTETGTAVDDSTPEPETQPTTANGRIPDREEEDTSYEIDSDHGLDLIVAQDTRTAKRETEESIPFEAESRVENVGARIGRTKHRLDYPGEVDEEHQMEDRVHISYHDTSSEKITNIITNEQRLKKTRKKREISRYCWRCGYIIPAGGTWICIKCGHNNQ